MATVGSLVVKLTAHTKQFRDGLRKSGRHLTTFRNSVVGLTRGVAGLGATLTGVAVGGGFVVMIKREMDAIDRTAKLSDQLGIATESLQALRHAADQTGAGAQSLDAGLETMAKRLGEVARAGKGAAAPALEDLGLSAKKLSAMPLDQAFTKIAASLEKIEEPAKRNAIAANLFSKANMGLLNTLSLGEAGLDKMRIEAERLGLTFSRMEAAKIEAASDAMDRLGKATRGFATQAALDLAPFMKMWGDDMATKIGATGRQIGVVGQSMSFVADAVDVVSDAFKFAKWQVYEFGSGILSMAVKARKALAGLPGMSSLMGSADTSFLVVMADEMEKTAARLGKEFNAAWIEKSPSERAAAIADGLERAAANAAKVKQGLSGIDTELAEATLRAADFTQKLQDQVDFYGKSASQKMILEMEERGDLSGAGEVDRLQKQLDTLDRQAKMMDFGASLREQFMTPAQEFEAKLKDLEKWKGMGVGFDTTTFERAIKAARTTAMDAMAPPKMASETLPTFASAAGAGSQEAYSRIVQAGYKGPEKDAGVKQRHSELKLLLDRIEINTRDTRDGVEKLEPVEEVSIKPA